MSRLFARAVLVASVAALALSQLDRGQQLLAWELLLLGVVIWEMRRVPGSAETDDPPLFQLSSSDAPRLPRSVSSMELNVIDAVLGHLGPSRRLQPALKRIAQHRLRRRGLSFDSPAAAAALGEDQWRWLAQPGDEPPSLDDIELLVERLESL